MAIHRAPPTTHKRTLKLSWMLSKRSYLWVSVDGRISMPSILNGHTNKDVPNRLASLLRPNSNRYVSSLVSF